MNTSRTEYEPVIDADALINFLASLPFAIRITPRVGDTGVIYIWQVLQENGSSDDLQTAVHEAILSMTQQLVLHSEVRPHHAQ